MIQCGVTGESGNRFLGNRRISDTYFPGDDAMRPMWKIERRRGCVFPVGLLERHVSVLGVILRRHWTLNSDINLDFQSSPPKIGLPSPSTEANSIFCLTSSSNIYVRLLPSCNFSTLLADLMLIVRLSHDLTPHRGIIISVS